LNVIKENLSKILQHKGFRRYAANTSWMFAEQILRMIAGLLVGIWVARYLGPAQFGVFSYVLAFTSIFAGIAKLGLDSIVVRNLVKDSDMRDVYLGTAFWLKVGGAVMAFLAITLGTFFTSNDKVTNLYIFIIAGGLIFQGFEVIDFYFQSKVLSKFVSLCKMTQLLISSILKIYFVFTGAGLFWFVLVSLFDQVTLGLSLAIAYRTQKHGGFYRFFDVAIARILLKNSWPMMLTSLVLMIQARIDQVMLKEMVGNIEVGYYSSAMRFIETVAFVPVILSNSLFPALVNAKNSSAELYKERLYNLYRLMMLLFIMVAIPVYYFGGQIINLLFGSAYSPAGHLLSLMSIRLFFANYGIARGAFLITENLLQYSMLTMLLGTVVNLLLNYRWIPVYHSVGSIWASIISFFITIFFVDFLFENTRGNLMLMLKSVLLIKFPRRA
jgi:O-antigen/teichoic acid export membrane protein